MEANSDTKKFEEVRKDTALLCTSRFFNSEELSDVILVVGEMKFYAHRFVLAKSSSVLKTMLYEKHWPESAREDVTLKETPECQVVFDIFIKYLYTGEVSIDVQHTISILSLADKYDVTSLKDLCISYMIEKSYLVQIETAVSWYTWAKTMNFDTLVSACFEAITLNTKYLIQSIIWVDLDTDLLEQILSSSELVIDQEYDLFLGLVRWLFEECRVASLKENSEFLLPLIRFPQIQGKAFRKIEQSKLAADKDCSDTFKGLLGRAFRFRAIHLHGSSPDFADTFYMPRDYLNPKVYGCEMRSDQGSLFLRLPYTSGRSGDTRRNVQTTKSNDVKVGVGPGVSGGESGLWNIHLTCTGTSVLTLRLCAKDLLGKEVPIQASLLVTDMNDRVLQSKRTPIQICQTGSELNVDMTLSYPDEAKQLLVLIKPMPYCV